MDDNAVAGGSVWRLARLFIIAAVAVVTVALYADSLSAAQYLPFAFGGAYAVTVVLGRPAWMRLPLVETVLDTAFVSSVVLATGGRSSIWIWLYVVAAAGLVRTSWAGRWRLLTAIVSGGVLLASFLLAAMTTEIGYGTGTGRRIEPAAVTFDLRVDPIALGLFVLAVGIVAVAVGLIYRRSEDARASAESVAAGEIRFSELATLMVRRFSRHQYGFNEQRILDTLVRAAVKDLGYGYARAESFGDEEGAGGRVQEAVRGSKAVMADEIGSGVTDDGSRARSQHLLVDLAGNTRGRILVFTDGKVGDERALRVLIEQSAEALSAVRGSPGGRDPVTDLPTLGSLRRTLRENVACEPRISVLAAEIDGLDGIEEAYGAGATDAVLVEVSKALGRDFSEVYCLAEHLYGVVPMPRPANRARTREEALSVQTTVVEAIEYALESLPVAIRPHFNEASVSYECSVGFVEGVGEYSAEYLLRVLGPALEAARLDPDGIGGPGQLMRWRSIESLLSAVGTVEPRLARHLHGTADLARRIGERLGDAELDLEGLEVGALVHDVGKWTVSPRVAHGDPFDLDDVERSEYLAVPERGHTMLQDRSEADLPEAAYLTVLTHRERYDGEGFPSGFAGDDIPLCGRITAVADAVDDVLRQRLEPQRGPYAVAERLCERGRREVMTEVRNLLTADRGSAFDPAIVDAALGVVDEIEAKASMIG